MGFRKAQSIIKSSPGGYVRGEWVDGAPIPDTVYGSVQPVQGRELEVLPEGRRNRETVKMYTDAELNTTETGQQPDILEWRGNTYEIVMKQPWQSDVINHFKYYATKVPNDPDGA